MSSFRPRFYNDRRVSNSKILTPDAAFCRQGEIDTCICSTDICAIINHDLRFNICELETSSIANKDIPDLGQRVNNKVCESLQYSCLYWVSHFAEASRQATECHVIEFFRSLRVLYWLEVLGLIGGMRNGLDALRCLAGLYEVCFNFPYRDLS